MIAVKIIPRDSHEQGQKWNFLRRYHSSYSKRILGCVSKQVYYVAWCIYTYICTYVHVYMHMCICTHTHIYVYAHIYIVYLTHEWGWFLHDKFTLHKAFLRICCLSLSSVPPLTCIHSTSIVFSRVLPLSWGFGPLLRGLHPDKLTVSFTSYGIFQFHLFLSTSHYVKMPFWIALITLDFIWKNLQ